MKNNFWLLTVLSMSFCLVVLNASANAAQNSDNYEQWLENYNAYDRLEQEIVKHPEKDSPEATLKRANVYLKLNSPQKALNIIEMTPPFEDNATEAMRLWYGGQAHRAKGDLTKAVFWFTQASKYMNDKSLKRSLFRQEKDLELIWKDVWRQLYWSYCSNFTLSKSNQLKILNDILKTGEETWSDDFWEKADRVYQFEATGNATLLPTPAKSTKENAPFISSVDQQAIAKTLSAVALEEYEQADQFADSISRESVKTFWKALESFIRQGTKPESLDAFKDKLKAHAFWSGHILAPYSAHNDWILGDSNSAAWIKFRDKLLKMPAEQGKTAITKELGSMLISEQTATLLQGFRLAFSLVNDDMEVARDAWNQVERSKLPISLQVAGLIAFGDSIDKVMPASASASQTLYPVVSELCSAAGKAQRPGINAPFWETIPQSRLRHAAKTKWPLDRLILLAYWQKILNKKPNTTLAKRAAHVFRNSAFGINSMLYLVDMAIDSKDMQLAAFYLNQLKKRHVNKEYQARWLEAKTRLELGVGKQDKALETYGKLMATNEPVPAFTRLRMALLMQQRGELPKARAQLLDLWSDKDDYPTAMQAEILFWLGEGEQAMRNTDAALDYYLKLAWKYPQENIWALTAMYRASMIYEQRGKFETAKKFLKTVIKRADTKEQREAAKARLSTIESKSGGGKSKNSSDDQGIQYPF